VLWKSSRIAQISCVHPGKFPVKLEPHQSALRSGRNRRTARRTGGKERKEGMLTQHERSQWTLHSRTPSGSCGCYEGDPVVLPANHWSVPPSFSTPSGGFEIVLTSVDFPATCSIYANFSRIRTGAEVRPCALLLPSQEGITEGERQG
jgi:hypothetical protein